MSTRIPYLVYHYKNGEFAGGLVYDSDHDQNELYMSFTYNDDGFCWIHELTVDEACAIIACLAHAMMAREGVVKEIISNEEENSGT